MTLTAIGVHKSYAANHVLRGVDLTVAPGQVRALLGPNGAGKSTLIKCLAGAVTADSGAISLDGAELPALTPATAREHGIVTIHQHPSLIGALTVSDNIFLGSEQTRAGLIDRRGQVETTRRLLEQFGIPASPSSVVADLPIGVRQLIEIAKSWHSADVRVLILDEPTAALSAGETERLFAEVEKMRRSGTRIVYTTHRLSEVFEIADAVTVIGDGRVVLDEPTSQLVPSDVIRAISPGARVDATRSVVTADGSPSVRVRGLAGPRFGPVDLDIRPGEVLGLFGSVGSGRTSLIETIAGHFRSDRGTVAIDGKTLRARSPLRAIRAGVRLVPSDRGAQALWANLSAQDNALMPNLHRFTRRGLRSFRSEKAAFGRVADTMSLRPDDPVLPASGFSGGNQQKLVVGRLLVGAGSARLLLFDEPTQGVDIGTRQQIYDAIHALVRDTGSAVLVSSSEPDEILALAARSVVMHGGEIVAHLEGEQLDAESLLAAAHQFVAHRKGA